MEKFRQKNPRLQTPGNNLPGFGVQAPGSSPSRPVQIVHHRGAVYLNQDVHATQPPVESPQGEENSLQLKKADMGRRLIA